ncbi:MAG: NHL repeat-containing protein [Candidatus Aquicultorales bacterium]
MQINDDARKSAHGRIRRTLGTRAGKALVLAGAVGFAATGGYMYFKPKTSAPRRVSALEYPAQLEKKLSSDVWKEPADIAIQDGDSYVVDPVSSGLYHVNEDSRTIEKSALSGRLAGPMAADGENDRLYIADSGSGTIVVKEGDKTRSIPLPSGPEKPRPIGVSAAAGRIVVSDANNHRVLILNEAGRLLKKIGTGRRDSSNRGFNVPGGVALGEDGSIYVVDILNGRVQQFDLEGVYLKTIGSAGDTAGMLARPKNVEVDREGNVFVSDSLQAAISVFSKGGKYLGFIGRSRPGDKKAASVFKAVGGLKIVGDRLYVVDRLDGRILVFKLPS